MTTAINFIKVTVVIHRQLCRQFHGSEPRPENDVNVLFVFDHVFENGIFTRFVQDEESEPKTVWSAICRTPNADTFVGGGVDEKRADNGQVERKEYWMKNKGTIIDNN